jgi:hypothetical protein
VRNARERIAFWRRRFGAIPGLEKIEIERLPAAAR